jgi:hypothetical protein
MVRKKRRLLSLTQFNLNLPPCRRRRRCFVVKMADDADVCKLVILLLRRGCQITITTLLVNKSKITGAQTPVNKEGEICVSAEFLKELLEILFYLFYMLIVTLELTYAIILKFKSKQYGRSALQIVVCELRC